MVCDCSQDAEGVAFQAVQPDKHLVLFFGWVFF